MRFADMTSVGTIGIGLLAFLTIIPLIYAQRSLSFQHNTSSRQDVSAQRSAPANLSGEHRRMTVDRVNHGTIRHVNAHVDQRPIEMHRAMDARQHVFVHRDVDVDIDHSRFGRDFVFGRRVRTLRAGCPLIIVNGAPYYYDSGIYYQQAEVGYQEVYPPMGANIQELPDGAIAIEVDNRDYYYMGGAFYMQQGGGGFVIAAPPMGVMVPELPPGTVQVLVNGNVAYQFNGIYYRPVFVNGVTQFMTFMP